MSQQYATLAFIGVVFIAILAAVTFLTAIKAIGAELIGQVVIAEVSAVAGLLAPSPLSVGKPPTP
jgi:hypothetical protein